jgi:hypothetical protein
LNSHFRSKHVGRFLASRGELIAAPPEGGFHEVARSYVLEAAEAARATAPA